MTKKRVVKPWTDSDDRIFIEMLNELVLEKSFTLSKAISQIALKLKRSENACNFRYNNTLRNMVSNEVLDKIRLNNPANAKKAANEQLILRLNEVASTNEIDTTSEPDISNIGSNISELTMELRNIEKSLIIKKKELDDLETKRTEVINDLKLNNSLLTELISKG